MNCKNCGHILIVDGTRVDAKIAHKNIGGGCIEKCPFCNCVKPERRSSPKYCKNCGCEVAKKKTGYPPSGIGKWHHINLNNPNLNAEARVGYLVRELEIECNCGCKNPEPEKPAAKEIIKKMNQAYYNRFQIIWTRGDSHVKGCLLEGMVGEFQRKTIDEQTFLECLLWVAATLK